MRAIMRDEIAKRDFYASFEIVSAEHWKKLKRNLLGFRLAFNWTPECVQFLVIDEDDGLLVWTMKNHVPPICRN